MSFFDGLGQTLQNAFANPSFGDSVSEAQAFLNGNYGAAIQAGAKIYHRHHPGNKTGAGVAVPGQNWVQAGPGAMATGDPSMVPTSFAAGTGMAAQAADPASFAMPGVDPSALPAGVPVNAPVIGDPTAPPPGFYTDGDMNQWEQAGGSDGGFDVGGDGDDDESFYNS